MRRVLASSLCVVALGPLGAAHGQQLFKCVGATGKTSYQEEPCPVAAKAQIVPPVDRFCTCVTRRVASTSTHAEYLKNPGGLRERVAAVKDGPCKPDGLLAEMWRKTGKMK